MLHFFRRLRQGLLTEDRVSRYLLYALGEIVLVVIGILIALSIDSWNSQRIEEIRVTSYYNELSKEFEGIGNSIRMSLSENDSILQELDAMLELLQAKPSGYQDAMLEQLPILYEVPDIHIVTLIIDEFANSGLFSKLNNASRQLVIHLVLNIEEINRQDQWAKEQHISNIEPYLLKNLSYRVAGSGEAMVNGESGETPVAVSELVHDREFRNVLKLKRNIHKRIELSLSEYLNSLTLYRQFLENQ